MTETAYVVSENRERLDVTAVDVFDGAVGEELQHDEGGVLADFASTEELVDERSDLDEGLAGEELRVDDALEGCGDDGGGDSLAGDVGDGEADAVVDPDRVIEVAADVRTRDAVCLDDGVRHGRELYGHQAAMDASGDAELFACGAGELFGMGEKDVFDQGCGFGGDGVEQLVIDLGELAGGYLAVEVEKAEQVGLVLGRVRGGARVCSRCCGCG